MAGVYAGGSFALGAYEAGRSDLDVAAVVSRPLRREQKEAIVAAVRHESLRCPARGLELVVYAREAVEQPRLDAAFELNLNTGARMAFLASFTPGADAEHWFPIDRSILREHGVALAGPPAAEVFAEFPREALLPILAASVRWHRESAEALDADSVLNACRALRFAGEGRWSSKLAAGEWAFAHLDEAEVVGVALARPPGRLEPSAVRAFLERAEAALRPPEGAATPRGT